MHRLLLFLVFALATLAETKAIHWLPVPEPRLEVNGLPWLAENKGELIRLPLRLKDTLPKAVWDLGRSPSGARIRFRTDSNSLHIRLAYPSPPNMSNMHAYGQTGVDLYLDGIYRGSAAAGKDARPEVTVEHTYFDLGGRPRAEREVTLYLPLYKPVKVLGIGIEEQARVSAPRPFALARPVVFYGTSITQGGCASRPGMSYQAMAGRMLNIDYVNLGFSGSGKGEPEVARMVAELDASCFVLDYSGNNRTLESLVEVYDAFIGTVRRAHPDTPILAITRISAAREGIFGNPKLEPMRQHIREVVAKRIAAGDTKLQLVEGTDLLGPDRVDGLVDGGHPNDLGFRWMAEGIAARLAKMLDLRNNK